jgi:hypothetical protein
VPQDPNAWLYGYWVQSGTMAPFSQVMEIRANGTWTMWNSYFATGEIEVEGTWSYVDGILSGASPFGSFSAQITKVSNNQWIMPDPPGFTFYRRGTEPGGWVFDQTPIPLSEGVWKEGEIERPNMDLYKFVAPTTSSYAIELRGVGMTDPYGNPYPYTMPFNSQYVYAADQHTLLSADWDWDVPELKTVDLNAGDNVYIIVDSREGGGTYAIRIVLFP